MTTLTRRLPTAAIIALVAVTVGAAIMLGVNYVSAPSAGAAVNPTLDPVSGGGADDNTAFGSGGATRGEFDGWVNDVEGSIHALEDYVQQDQVDVPTTGGVDPFSGVAVVAFPESFPADTECVNVMTTPVRNNTQSDNAPVFAQVVQPTTSQFTVRLFNKDVQGISDQNVRFMYTAFATNDSAECLA